MKLSRLTMLAQMAALLGAGGGGRFPAQMLERRHAANDRNRSSRNRGTHKLRRRKNPFRGIACAPAATHINHNGRATWNHDSTRRHNEQRRDAELVEAFDRATAPAPSLAVS